MQAAACSYTLYHPFSGFRLRLTSVVCSFGSHLRNVWFFLFLSMFFFGSTYYSIFQWLVLRRSAVGSVHIGLMGQWLRRGRAARSRTGFSRVGRESRYRARQFAAARAWCRDAPHSGRAARLALAQIYLANRQLDDALREFQALHIQSPNDPA